LAATGKEVELVTGEKEIIPFDDKPIEDRLKDFGNVIEKANARAEFHYYLWMMGKNYKAIRDVTGYSRYTIADDVKRIRDRLPSKDLSSVRDETLLMLRIDRSKAMDFVDDPDMPPKDRSKFMEIIMKIDLEILDRFTQQGKGPVQELKEEYDEEMKAVLDYMVEKMGPSAISDFSEWWGRKKSLIGHGKTVGYAEVKVS
jgi:hypothetical protein